MDYTLDDVKGMGAEKSFSLSDVAAMGKQKPTFRESAQQQIGNIAAGALRGFGSIGDTLLTPIDAAARAVGVKNDFIGRTDRRSAMDSGLETMGAEPDSLGYKGGKLGGEILGTAGVGGVIAKPLQALAASRYAAGVEPLLNGGIKALQSGGFRVGELAGTGAGVAARVGGGAAVGGAAAGLANPEDAGTGALIGGALPGAAKLAGTVGGGIRNSLTGGGLAPEVAALAGRAKALGISIPADRLVDSKPLNALAGSLNYVPLSGRAATEDAMNSQLNTALSRTFGQNSSNVTQALRKAEGALGGEFDRVLRTNTVAVDRQFMTELAESANRASQELGADGAGIIGKQVDDILSKAGSGQIDGQTAYNLKKTLDRIGNRNTPEAFYAGDLKKTLMGALNRSLGPEEAASFATTRQQYGNMLDLRKLAPNGGEGEISVARLANMRGIKNGQMQELADIAAQFVKPRESAHGSAQRVTLGGLAAAAGIANPGALPVLAASMAAGRGTNMLLNSNAAKNFVLRKGLLEEPETLGLLSQGAYRAAPFLLQDR